MSHPRRATRITLATVGALVGVLGLTSTNVASASRTSDPTARFSQAGRAAGLTGSQIGWLQAEVDRDISRSGGQQVALNVVQREGAQLRIALPGESRPRHLGGRGLAASPCDGGTAPGWFCAYSSTFGRGSQLGMYRCGTYSLPGWSGFGSWGDNQTAGTQSLFQLRDHTTVKNVFAPSNSQEYNWDPIWFIKNC
ncbi:hypothetical protein [Luteipulveratus mongoliensis]|uniref:hypothetical protein n=1 Tax=Luteipulveratus mongoliensis TaxID=571913 RepID=UPI0006960A08|nr:hypothetical protein [Luteipulveratus mongoliensis]